MYLKKVNLICEQIQKQSGFLSKIGKGLKKLTSARVDYEAGRKLGNKIGNFLVGKNTKNICKKILDKYLPKIKSKQLKEIITLCNNQQQIIFDDKTNIAKLNSNVFMRQILKTAAVFANPQDPKDQEMAKILQEIKSGKHNIFDNDDNQDLAQQYISEFNLQNKLNDIQFKDIIDPKKESITHKIKQIKLV